MQRSAQTWDLSRAHGRCTGAAIFTIFGACWFLLSQAYFHRFGLPVITMTCGIVTLLLLTCLRIQRGQPKPDLAPSLAERKRRDDRMFGIINGVTYTLVFLLFAILPRFGLQNYVFPSFVALVGLHFLPMPPSYRHLSNVVIGLVMIGWSLFCAIHFKEDGNRMAAFVALGAAVALWSGSAWALGTAHRLFSHAKGA